MACVVSGGRGDVAHARDLGADAIARRVFWLGAGIRVDPFRRGIVAIAPGARGGGYRPCDRCCLFSSLEQHMASLLKRVGVVR